MLLEREPQIRLFMWLLKQVAAGHGRVALVSGEAGAGKTTLIQAFARHAAETARVFRGACEDLSIPDPLGPLYDLARDARWALKSDSPEKRRLSLFSDALAVFETGEQPTVLVIEDLHWADDATLDFVRFMGRRIADTHILLLLTARIDDSGGQRHVRRALADVPPDNLARMSVPSLSEAAVGSLALEAGRDGSEIYLATAGNAFFVSELLRTNSPGKLPPGVVDAVLARAEKLSAEARHALDAVSVFPGRVEAAVVSLIFGKGGDDGLAECVAAGMLVERDNSYMFRHEIARRAVEAALAPVNRRSLNAAALGALQSMAGIPSARLLHHAVAAQDRVALRELAPVAAAEAARLGSHREAARLAATALGVVPPDELATRAALYQQLAFESHLIGAVADAIDAQTQARQIYSGLGDRLKEGDSIRWLSRLSYLFGDRTGADSYAREALELLQDGPPGPELAMALSNVAHLGMLADRVQETLLYGRKALALAEQLGRADIACHALNNVGVIQQWTDSTQARKDLVQSLEMALSADYQEHAARAYTNLACMEINLLAYGRAEEVLQAGMEYCLSRDLDTWRDYMRAWQAELLMRRGRWDQAADTALLVLNNDQSTPLARYPATLALARIRVRRGDPAADLLASLSRYLERGMELQRFAPYATLMAERAWLGQINKVEALLVIDRAVAMLPSSRVYAELFYWRAQLGGGSPDSDVSEIPAPYAVQLHGDWRTAAAGWAELGVPFDRALSLLAGGDMAQGEALEIMRHLGARATAERIMQLMQERGVSPVRRGPYRVARDNPAGLTGRQMDVLQLLAQGLSNKAIAKSLAISPKTVDHHVSAVLGKVDAMSRSEAIVLARIRGLI